MNYRRKGDKQSYAFVDIHCIGRECWAPGLYQHRGASGMGMGSHATGTYSSCCMNRAYRGCPDGPEGERKEYCGQCDGTVSDGPDKCGFCGGFGEVTHVGLPVFNPELAKRRKAEGWRKA
jgi:hypothetical protein